MLFFSFFKTLEGKGVTVELKNGLQMRGVLHSVDQFLNLKLSSVAMVNEAANPHLLALKNAFIRGSVVRYVHLDPSHVDTTLLQDAARREYQEIRAPPPKTNAK